MDYIQDVCYYRSGYNGWNWILLRSVIFFKILWKLISRNFWYFNIMSDLEEYDNKVMKSNEEVVVKLGFKQVGYKKKNLEFVKEEI